MSWRRTGCFDGVEAVVDSYVNPDDYEALDCRLRTFILPPPWKGSLCYQLMAEAGFVYTGQEDLVYCFSCNIKLDGWTKHMDPLLRHKEESGTCSFVKQLRKRRRKDRLVTTPLKKLPTAFCQPLTYTVVSSPSVTQGTEAYHYPEYSHHQSARPQSLKCVAGCLATESAVYCQETDKVTGKQDKHLPCMMSSEMDMGSSNSVLLDTVSEPSSLFLPDDKPLLFPAGSSDFTRDDMEEDDLLFTDQYHRFGEAHVSTSSLQNCSRQQSLISSSSQVCIIL